MSSTESNVAETPWEDLRARALRAYEEAATVARSWSSVIPRAINFYFDNAKPLSNTVPDADRITSRNLKAEARRAYAAAEQHRVYQAQAASVSADQCRAAHERIADGYGALAIALVERARYFAKRADELGEAE